MVFMNLRGKSSLFLQIHPKVSNKFENDGIQMQTDVHFQQVTDKANYLGDSEQMTQMEPSRTKIVEGRPLVEHSLNSILLTNQ